MSERYRKSTRTIRRYFEEYTAHTGEIPAVDTALGIVFDATFFGRTYGLLVFRAQGKNLFWKEISAESRKEVSSGLDSLDAITQRQYKSFTIDGRRGIVQLLLQRYAGIPVQLCHFHQQQTITRYITKNPKSACGRSIKALMMTLGHTTEEAFTTRIQHIKKEFEVFLREKNERGQYMHRRLRSAVRSLETNTHYLFTYQRYPELQIPHTTNSCDGSFAHWKQKIGIHRGLKKHRRKKMIDTLLSL